MTVSLGAANSLIESSVSRHVGILIAIWLNFVIIWEIMLEVIKYKSTYGEKKKFCVTQFPLCRIVAEVMQNFVECECPLLLETFFAREQFSVCMFTEMMVFAEETEN